METPEDQWPNEGMTEQTTPPADAPEAPQLPEEQAPGAPYVRRLERIDDGKWIAGVATGLGEYFSVPAWLVRLIFIFLLAPAGLGILVYLVLAVIMPHESEDESPAQRWFTGLDNPEQTLGIGLAVVAALGLLASTTNLDGGAIFALILLGVGIVVYQHGSLGGPASGTAATGAEPEGSPETEHAAGDGRPPRPPREPRQREPREPKPPKAPRAPRPKSNLGAYTFALMLIVLGLLGSADIAGILHPRAFHYVAVALSVIGLGLVVGAWRGRSRGLILLGLAVLPVLSVTWVTGNVDKIVDEWERLADSGSIHQDEYLRVEGVTGTEHLDFGVGEVTVDLTEAEFAEHSALAISMDVGKITVIVPPDVRVRASVDLGDIDRPGRDLDGIDVSTVFGPALVDASGYVTVRLDLGQIVIVERN